MKIMSDYGLYCTAEQTKKALELGAPIQFASINDIRLGRYIEVESNNKTYVIPTNEQMIEWLRKEHNIHVRIDCEGSKNYVVQLQFINSSKDIDVENNNYKGIIGHKGYPSVPEATLAAIDAALDYLINKNKV